MSLSGITPTVTTGGGNKKQILAAQNKLYAEQLLYHKQCPTWIRSLSRNDSDIAAVIVCNQSLQQVKHAFIYTYHNELLLLQLANGIYRLAPDGSDHLVKPVLQTTTVGVQPLQQQQQSKISPVKNSTTTTDKESVVSTPNVGSSNTPTVGATGNSNNGKSGKSTTIKPPTTSKVITTIQFQSISYDEISLELQELCVDFLLRCKLRKKLISRIIRRLQRIATSMDHYEQLTLNLPTHSTSITNITNTVNNMTDVIIPPGPPKYGDLRLYCDPNAVTQYEQIRSKQKLVLQQIQFIREQDDFHTNVGSNNTNKNDVKNIDTDRTIPDVTSSSNPPTTKGDVIDNDQLVGTAPTVQTQEDENKEHSTTTADIVEEENDEGKDNVASAVANDLDEKTETTMTRLEEKVQDDGKNDTKVNIESSVVDAVDVPSVAAVLSSSNEGLDAGTNPSVSITAADYELLKDYKDAYEKSINCTITTIKDDDNVDVAIPSNVSTFLQTVMDDMTNVKYTMLENPREEDYMVIQNGTGIGATHASMSTQEREVEYHKWQNNILSRIPDQPTYSELGLEHRVFLYKERFQRATMQLQQQQQSDATPTVSPSKTTDDVKSSLKRKLHDDDDDMDVDELDVKKATSNDEDKESQEANEGDKREDEDDTRTKEDIKKEDDHDEAEDAAIVAPKMLRPISLVAIPSFYEQDLKRIKLVQADLMGSSMRRHAIQQLEEVTREFNQCLANSMELANQRTILQTQINQLAQQTRALTQSVQSDYMVQVSLTKNRWNLDRCSFETNKLNKMLPSRNGIMPTGSMATQNYKVRPDTYVVGLNEVVATCIADIVDCVDNVAHGRMRNDKWREPFILPSANTDVDSLQRAKKLEANKKNELNTYTLKLRTSEGERLRAWRKMLKTKMEYDIPHQHYSSSGQVRVFRLDPQTCLSLPLPALHQTAAQDVPEKLPGQSSKVASYAPMHTVRQPSNHIPPSESKYSTARVRERIATDGTVAPVTKPKMTAEGLYARPAGRTRKGMEWDAVRGIWIPGSEMSATSS